MPPCNREPCLNGGVCRNVDNYNYRCDCSETHYKGLRCDIGVIDVQQPPILKEKEKVTLSVIAHPTNILHLHLITEQNSGISISSHQLTFTSTSTTVPFVVTAVSQGIHFIHFNISNGEIGEYEVPPSIAVIVTSLNTTNSNHTHPYFSNTEYGVLNLQAASCCQSTTADSYLSCPVDPALAITLPSLASSCEWINNTETAGIVFASNKLVHIPISFIGAYARTNHPIISLPSSDYTCSQCSPLCQSYDLSQDDVIDLIKSHALVRTFLKYTEDYFPDWIHISVIEFYAAYETFNSYDVIADIVYGKDIVLIEDCQNLNLLADDLYTIIRTNTSLDVSVDNDQLVYLPAQLTKVPVCFAVSLCEYPPMIHVAIPQWYQQQLNNITRIQVSCKIFMHISYTLLLSLFRPLLFMDGILIYLKWHFPSNFKIYTVMLISHQTKTQ